MYEVPILTNVDYYHTMKQNFPRYECYTLL